MHGSTLSELRQVPQVVPLDAVPVSRQVFVINEMDVSPDLPLVIGRLRPRLECRVASTNEISHEGTRNGSRCSDFDLSFPLNFLSYLHILDVALILVVTDGRDAEICHISLLQVDGGMPTTNMAA